MSGQTESPYKLKKKDIPKAGAVLADAFQYDPVWAKIFEGEAKSNRELAAWHEGAIRCRHK
jgi:hypothetical protein